MKYRKEIKKNKTWEEIQETVIRVEGKIKDIIKVVWEK